jgi:hypothetical protein
MTIFPSRFLQILLAISVIYGASVAAADKAAADGIAVPALRSCQTITLLCENSRTYGLCPIAVTDVGELVTARLTAPHSVHVRFVPMGDGYRYAGKGIWFDGKDAAGRLYFGSNRSVACSVSW